MFNFITAGLVLGGGVLLCLHIIITFTILLWLNEYKWGRNGAGFIWVMLYGVFLPLAIIAGFTETN